MDKYLELIKGLYPGNLWRKSNELDLIKIQILRTYDRWDKLTKDDLNVIIDYLLKYIEETENKINIKYSRYSKPFRF